MSILTRLSTMVSAQFVLVFSLSAAVLTVNPLSGPYYTVSDAANDAVAGDVISVQNGNYDQENGIYLRQGVTIRGESRDGVLIDATTVSYGSFMTLEGDNVIEKLTLQGNNLAQGIASLGKGDYLELKDCALDGLDFGLQGIIPPSLVIERSLFNQVEGPAIDVQGYDPSSGQSPRGTNFLRVYDNVYTNSGGGLHLVAISVTDMEVINNTFDNLPIAIDFDEMAYAENLVIRNNIFSNMWDMLVIVDAGTVSADYNGWWNNFWEGTPLLPEGMDYGPNDLFADPLYSDPATLDYSLASGSPYLDYGDPNYPYTLSDGTTRLIVGVGFPNDQTSGPGSVPPISSALKDLQKKLQDLVASMSSPIGKMIISSQLRRLDRTIARFESGKISEKRLLRQMTRTANRLDRFADRMDRVLKRSPSPRFRRIITEMRDSAQAASDTITDFVAAFS